MRSGYLKLSKMPLAVIRRSIVYYLKDDPELTSIFDRDQRHEVSYERAVDVSILNRLVFWHAFEAQPLKGWFGPCESFQLRPQPWKLVGGRWELGGPSGLGDLPMAGYAALDEFDAYSWADEMNKHPGLSAAVEAPSAAKNVRDLIETLPNLALFGKAGEALCSKTVLVFRRIGRYKTEEIESGVVLWLEQKVQIPGNAVDDMYPRLCQLDLLGRFIFEVPDGLMTPFRRGADGKLVLESPTEGEGIITPLTHFRAFARLYRRRPRSETG